MDGSDFWWPDSARLLFFSPSPCSLFVWRPPSFLVCRLQSWYILCGLGTAEVMIAPLGAGIALNPGAICDGIAELMGAISTFAGPGHVWLLDFVYWVVCECSLSSKAAGGLRWFSFTMSPAWPHCGLKEVTGRLLDERPQTQFPN